VYEIVCMCEVQAEPTCRIAVSPPAALLWHHLPVCISILVALATITNAFVCMSSVFKCQVSISSTGICGYAILWWQIQSDIGYQFWQQMLGRQGHFKGLRHMNASNACGSVPAGQKSWVCIKILHHPLQNCLWNISIATVCKTAT
jgi:hypothetical protein